MTRIGPKMSAVVSFIAANPGEYMLRAAEYVGPNGSRRYGYTAVHRAIKAGLVEAVREARGTRLYPRKLASA